MSEPRSKFDESLSSMMLLNLSEEEKPTIQTPPTLSQRRNDEDSVQFNEHTITSVATCPWGSYGNPRDGNQCNGNEHNPHSKVQSAANLDTRLSSWASHNEASEMVFHPPLQYDSRFENFPSDFSTSGIGPSRNYSSVVVDHLAGSMRIGQFHGMDIGKMEPMADGDLHPLWANALVGVDSIPDRYPLPACTRPEFEFTNLLANRSGKRKDDFFPSVSSEVAEPINFGVHVDPEYSDLHRHGSLGNQFLNQHASTGMGSSSGLLSELVDCNHLVTVESSESLVQGTSIPVPSPIPQELQALVDAFVFGKPLTVLTSNQRFYDIWSLLLPKEYGYVMLGFFRIIGVEVRCLFNLYCSPTYAVS
jgi:hypothetical protein